MLLPHPVDLIAILLGIFLAMRKTEVRAEEAARYPQVPVEDFERWRALALRAYTIGTVACFAKVILDFACAAIIQRWSLPVWLVRTVGVSLDVGWVVALVVCWLRSRAARKLGEQMGLMMVRSPDKDASGET